VRNKTFLGFVGEDDMCFVWYFFMQIQFTVYKNEKNGNKPQKNADKTKIIHKKKGKL
jgi:hypothetical protein